MSHIVLLCSIGLGCATPQIGKISCCQRFLQVVVACIDGIGGYLSPSASHDGEVDASHQPRLEMS